MKNKNDSAFPILNFEMTPQGPVQINGLNDGLTKREYFASLAMQGIVSNNEMLKRLDAIKEFGEMKLHERVAVAARDYSDALLLELQKKEE